MEAPSKNSGIEAADVRDELKRDVQLVDTLRAMLDATNTSGTFHGREWGVARAGTGANLHEKVVETIDEIIERHTATAGAGAGAEVGLGDSPEGREARDFEEVMDRREWDLAAIKKAFGKSWRFCRL